MNTKKIKTTILTLATTAIATFGLAACDTGTDPGEVNTERSDIREEGSMVGGENEGASRYDTAGADMERHYDHADHENHNGERTGAVHAGDGKDSVIQRDDVQ
ncbi:hypothetical protein [Pontibacter diazotrophicus]|nr:hypothetical protein [Pontibacter diazotrophicus]